MTFDPNADIRSDNVRRAGGGSSGGGFPRGPRRGRVAIPMTGGGIGITLVVFVLAATGVIPASVLDSLLGAGSATGSGYEQPVQPHTRGGALTECRTGADANRNDDCLVQATVESADGLWSRIAPAAGIKFREPQTVIFSRQVATACGNATSATGPFYCPADSTIYIDTSFYRELQARFGSSSGQLAKSYVVAHEYGHHIQNLQGAMRGINRRSTGPQSDAVRLELQADCYAGVWARHAASTPGPGNSAPLLKPLTKKDVQDALSAAAAVGDDHIQKDVAGGQVQPESWTHGSSQQRQRWFITGYNSGEIRTCDTFAADRV
ncbi:KPN_02809 family neutral zinc metallopeptidase [Dermabacteraceae bacterium P13115]